MKKQTYIDAAKIEQIIIASGLPTTVQAAFVKISGASGRNVYCPKQKRVGRIDLSGFEVDASLGVVDLGGESFGAVKQQMDFSLPEDVILANFTKILEHMKTLPAREVEKKKAPGTPKAKSEIRTLLTADMDPEARAKAVEALRIRRVLLEKVAAEKGVPISDKAGI